MKHYGDITKINGAEAPVVDIITGGSPCQDLSVAGKRAGLAGERSGLFMEQMRIVKEMRERERATGRTGWMVRPRYMVWENVPGAFSSGNPKGADFAAVIEEIIKVAEPGASVSVCVPNGGWTKSGCYYAEDGSWSLAWRVHDAQFWGVPQRRKRIALVADFGGLSAPEILFERKGLSRDPEPRGAEGQGTAGTAGDSTKSASGVVSKGNGEAFLMREKASSLTIGGGQAGQGYPCVMESLGEVGGGVRSASFYDAYQHHGWRKSETCGTLTVGQNNTVRGDTPLITAYGISSYDSNAMKSSNPHSGIYEADTARTLDLNGGSPACNQGGVAIVQAYCLQGNGIDRADTAGCNGKGWREDQCYTLNTIDRPAVVAFAQNQVGEVRVSPMSGTLNTNSNATGRNSPLVYDARGNGDGKTVCTITGDHQNSVTDYTALCVGNGQANQSVSDKAGALNTMHDQQAILTTVGALCARDYKGVGNQYVEEGKVIPQNAIVRRLTPLECERLQGYPDGWTDIGEWVDSKGKKHGEADSPRYKALGNSIALPFWQWMARRICAQYERPVTMASLFDGIGGFPLVFQRCGAVPVWASEIEEFPIAVTKVRFPDESVR